MAANAAPGDATVIADLNDLLQLDHDAVQAYTIAIDVVRSATYRDDLVAHRADHKRHIEELSTLVRDCGGLPTELPHPTAPLKLVVQALGSAPSDETLLLAFKAVEGQGRDKYRRFARKAYPQDVADVVRRAADDESRHYQWAEGALRELGVGPGSMPHTVASAIEGLHKLLADPIESAGRKVMEQVGAVVGTARQRAGGMAPSPADFAGTGASSAASNVPSKDTIRFIEALKSIEYDGNLEPMLALYDPTAETTGPADETPHRGWEGARHFWHMYRDSFERIRSTFTNIANAGDGTVMLEWTSAGTARGGQAVRYAGMSVLEMHGGRIRRFRTYFNPRDLDSSGVRSASASSAANELEL